MCTTGNKARARKSGCSAPGGLKIQRVKIFSGSPIATASKCQQPEIQMVFKVSLWFTTLLNLAYNELLSRKQMTFHGHWYQFGFSGVLSLWLAHILQKMTVAFSRFKRENSCWLKELYHRNNDIFGIATALQYLHKHSMCAVLLVIFFLKFQNVKRLYLLPYWEDQNFNSSSKSDFWV